MSTEPQPSTSTACQSQPPSQQSEPTQQLDSSQPPEPSQSPGPSEQAGPSRQAEPLEQAGSSQQLWPSQPQEQPQPGPSQPQPGPSQPQPGPSHPQPGPSHPQPGPSQPQPGPSQPQPGPSQPQPGPSQPQPGPSQPQPWPSHRQGSLDLSDLSEIDFHLESESEEEETSRAEREQVVISDTFDKALHTTLAVRIRRGRTSYREWMNEMQVYLLPNFRHPNLLQYYGCEHLDDQDDITEAEDGLVRKVGSCIRTLNYAAKDIEKPKRLQLEYWIVTKYGEGSVTMRDYLMANTISWPDMLRIAEGIMKGLRFLHEYQDNFLANIEDGTRGFIESTQGRIKGIFFPSGDKDHEKIIHLVPSHKLSVIHRNLSSLNVILKRDLTPCIWNFGTAYIHYPYQPINLPQLLPIETVDTAMITRYAPPEVILGCAQFTPLTMKAIDMYASGLLLWELMLRCRLPHMPFLEQQIEHLERTYPDPYYEPYAEQLGPQPSQAKLEYLVCKARARPTIKRGWLLGDKTNTFVQIIRELMDADAEARLQAESVIERLNLFDYKDYDTRFPGFINLGRTVHIPSIWSTIVHDIGSQSPGCPEVVPNIRFINYEIEQMLFEMPRLRFSEQDNALKKMYKRILRRLRRSNTHSPNPSLL